MEKLELNKISEESYKDLLENATDLIQSVAPDGSFVYVNRAWRETLGYGEEEIKKLSLFDIIHPDSMEHCKEIFKRVLLGEEVKGIEVVFVAKDGEKIWVEGNANCKFNKEGKPVATRGIFRDVTERKKVEEKLRESEKRYRLIAENTTDVVFVQDMDFNLTYVSPSVTFFTGYSVEEMIKLKWQDRMTPDSYKRAVGDFQKYAALIGTKRDYDIPLAEYEYVCKDGSILWGELKVKFLYDSKGCPVGVQGALREITERNKAKNRLIKLNKVFINLGSDFDKNIQLITETCGELLGSTCALYNRLRDGILYSVGQWQTPKDYNPVDKPDGHICFDVINKGKDGGIYIVKNLQETSYAQTDPNVAHYGLRTYVGHPVISSGKCVGSLCAVYQTDVEIGEDSKKILEILAIAIGIEEERKRAEEALRESEEKYRALVENTKDFIFMIDENNKVLFVNESASKFWGKPEEVIGRSIFELFPREIAEGYSENLKKVFKSGRGQFFSEDKIFVGDKELWTSVILSPIKNQEGKVTAVMGVTHDIAEQKKAEEEKHRLEEKYRETIESIFKFVPEGLLVFTDKLNLFKKNESFQDIVREYSAKLGYQEEELEKIIIEQVKDKIANKDYSEIRVSKKFAYARADKKKA